MRVILLTIIIKTLMTEYTLVDQAKQNKTVDNLKTVLIATGGTGGHVFPAISLAKKLQEQKIAKPVFITDKRAVAKFNFGNFPVHKISSGTPRGGFFKKTVELFKIAKGIIQSLFLIIKYRPSLIIGFGGYPSFPPILMGKLLGIKTIVHEQNSILGKVNEIAYKYFKSILALSLPLAGERQVKIDNKRAFLTGLPIRDIFYTNNKDKDKDKEKDHKKKASKESKNKKTINLLILGGSLGAQVFSTKLPNILGNLSQETKDKLRIKQQCRKELLEQTASLYKDLGFQDVELIPFIDDVASYMDWSDLIISRAGASTIFEIMAKKKPSILIPFPHATENHQYYNAQFLANDGRAIVINEEDLENSPILLEIFQKPETIERIKQKYSVINDDNLMIDLDLLVKNTLECSDSTDKNGAPKK